MALLWVIPAAIMGGDTYREDLLWGQTANRVIASFAHQRPLWWYFPFLPVLFFPWFFIKPVWLGMTGLKHDYGKRFVMIWIVSTLLLFSFISGKQIHYLIPMSAAGCMLFARNIATYHSVNEAVIKHHYPIAALYILIGGALLILPRLKLHGDTGHISFGMVGITSIGFIMLGGLMLFIRISSIDSMIKTIALSSLIALSIFVFSGKSGLFSQHDVKVVSQILKEKQAEGYKILNYGEYDGQYQFLGRLTQPLVVVKDENAVRDYIETFSKVLLIAYEKLSKPLDGKDILYQQLYRNKKLIVWKKEGIHYFLANLKH